MQFSDTTFTKLCSHQHYFPNRNCTHRAVTPPLPLLQGLVTSDLPSDPICLPVLEISRKWNQTTFVLSCPVSGFFHLTIMSSNFCRGSIDPNFLPFKGCAIFHCVYGPHVVYPRLCPWTWGGFHLLGLVKNAAANGDVQTSMLSGPCCHSFWVNPQKWNHWVIW